MDARRRPFKIGLFVPHFEQPWNGTSLPWTDIAAMAQRAEEIGFDSFWLPDHLLFRFPQVHQQGAWDAWSLLAALAATTQTIEIGPLVACTSFRNPALIAKMADTIDEISGGRLILGLGAGWHEPEYAAFGFPYDHRVSRFAEALQIITALLRTGHVDFEGDYYTARDCELRPRGPRLEGPPLLIGGSGERMLRLTARYGDAWNADRQNERRRGAGAERQGRRGLPRRGSRPGIAVPRSSASRSICSMHPGRPCNPGSGSCRHGHSPARRRNWRPRFVATRRPASNT